MGLMLVFVMMIRREFEFFRVGSSFTRETGVLT